MNVPSSGNIRVNSVVISDIPDDVMILGNNRDNEIHYLELDLTKICIANIRPVGINLATEYEAMKKVIGSEATLLAWDKLAYERFLGAYSSKPLRYQQACALVLAEVIKQKGKKSELFRLAARFKLNDSPLWEVFMIYAFNGLWEK